MALSAADLVAIREQQLTIQVLQEGNLDSRINELKGVLADIQAFQDLEALKKDLADRQLALDNLAADLYNKSIDLEKNTATNSDSNRTEKAKLLSMLNSIKDREGALASGVASLMDKEAEQKDSQALAEADLASRKEALTVAEALASSKLADLLVREEALNKKLEVLKGI